jgi:AcrR family transcriptional regulator
MATKPKPSKREAILDAMLDVIVERGFHEAPMSLIAERSGTSAGLIYHHFASKEEIIQALHDRIRAVKINTIFEGFSLDTNPKEAFIRGCENTYTFYRKHQKEMRFLDQYKHAGFSCPPEPLDEQTAALMQRFTARSKGGLLNEWPPEVIEEMTIGLMTRLAQRPRKIPPAVLREIAEGMWDVVRTK